MTYMFAWCSTLKEINVSNFNSNNVTNKNGMFYGCSSLRELNLYNFNINNIEDMCYARKMFWWAKKENFIQNKNFDGEIRMKNTFE